MNWSLVSRGKYMEAFLTSAGKFAIASGTFGSLAVTAPILLVYWWFKFIKPFLDEWRDMRSLILKNEDAYILLTKSSESLRGVIEEFNDDSEVRHEKLRDIINDRDNRLNSLISNEIENLLERIKTFQDSFEKHSAFDERKMNELLIELTKINMRLEMSGSNSQLRGIK